MTDPNAVARSLVLRTDDFTDPSWRVDVAPAGPDSRSVGIADILLGDDVPETAVRAAADSDRFVRTPSAAAFSAAILLHTPEASGNAWALLSSAGFAHEFAESVGGAVTPRPGDLEILDTRTDAIPPGTTVPGCESVTTHRSVLSTASAAGLTPIILDTIALRHRSAVVLVWLLDSPDPISTVERARVIKRIGSRISQVI